MRTVTSGIFAELTRSGAYPGHIIEITVANGSIIRVTTLDDDFTWDGQVYATADVSVPDIGFDGTVSRGGALEFGDQTIAVWIGNLYREFDEAPIRIWQVYAAAPGEAEQVFSGRCGKLTRKVNAKGGESASIALDAEATALFAPRRRVQDFIDQKWLIAAGTVLIVNGQRWIIDRPTSINT
jgi:hypothetical protein